MSSERDLKAETYIDFTRDDCGFCDCNEGAFKLGWDQALESEKVNKLREDNRIMREALEFYMRQTVTLTVVDEYLKDRKINMTNIFTKQAREALEKVK